MKLELKRVEYSERLSEETSAFAADLWINGKKAAYVKNDGRGGCTDYRAYDPSFRPLLKQAEDFCLALPSVKYNNNGNEYDFDMNLEFKIDTLFNEWLDNKDFKKKLIYRTKDGAKMECRWTGWTITKLLKSPSGIKVIEKKVKDLKSKGCTILNTNLDAILE